MKQRKWRLCGLSNDAQGGHRAMGKIDPGVFTIKLVIHLVLVLRGLFMKSRLI